VTRYDDGRVCFIQGTEWGSVSCVNVEPGELEQLVEQMRGLARTRNYVWWVGPSSRPPDLPDRLRALGFVTWVRRLVRTAWRAEQTTSAYVLALPTPPAPFSRAILLRTSTKTTTRAFCKSQAKAPSAIDVAAARDALEARRRVVEERLSTRQCSGLRRCPSISSISLS